MNTGWCLRSRPGRQGFTLVELLVVLAVIVLLGSITLPAVMGTRSHSYRVSCKTNLSQLGKGIFMYCSDSGLFFPANRPPVMSVSDPALPVFPQGYDDLSPLYGIPLERPRRDALGHIVGGDKVTSQPYVQNLKSFTCPAVSTYRDESALKALGSEAWKVLRYKRTGKTVIFVDKVTGLPINDENGNPREVAEAPDPAPYLDYEYCGEFDPGLHDTRLDTKAAWLIHDEDARTENSREVLTNKELSRLSLQGSSNHHGSGGNMLFTDNRVDWISAMDWPNRVMAGITEWQRITGYKLPDDRLEPVDTN